MPTGDISLCVAICGVENYNDSGASCALVVCYMYIYIFPAEFEGPGTTGLSCLTMYFFTHEMRTLYMANIHVHVQYVPRLQQFLFKLCIPNVHSPRMFHTFIFM